VNSKGLIEIQIGFVERWFGRATIYTLKLDNEKLEAFGGAGINLPIVDMDADIELYKHRLFWGRVVLNAKSKHAVVVAGMSWSKSIELFKGLNVAVASCKELQKNKLDGLSSLLDGVVTFGLANYLTYEKYSNYILSFNKVLGDLSFEFISAHQLDSCNVVSKALGYVNDREKIRGEINDEFRDNECQDEGNRKLFDTIEKEKLTDKQRDACTSLDRYTLVLAGAGSGKTSLIVGRAAYLLRKYPRDTNIIALAFGSDAKKELRSRFRECDVATSGQVMSSTFHALGYSVIRKNFRKKGERFPRPTKLVNEKLRDWIQNIVKEYSRRDNYFSKIVEYFISSSRDYVDPNIYDLKGDYYQRLIEIGTLTIKGEKVKSIEEVEVANFLFIHGIKYEYETQYPYYDKKYEPDFYLPDYDVWIEHFGIDENDVPAPFFKNPSAYIKGIKWKRGQHNSNGTKLVESYSYWGRDNILREELSKALIAKGVAVPEVSYDDFCKRVLNYRDSKIISGFYALIERFLSSFKASGRSLDDLEVVLNEHSYRSALFFSIFVPVLNSYEKRMKVDSTIDFADMILLSTKLIQQGEEVVECSDIIVDEYQDISPSRMQLIEEILKINPNARLFCVGDDKQAIMRFTGSDVMFTTRFSDRIGVGTELELDKTFRCNSSITETSTHFVLKNPEQKNHGVESNNKVYSPCIILVRYEEGREGYFLNDVLTKLCVGGKADVYVLGRNSKHKTQEVGRAISAHISSGNVRYSTMHSSKGSEADHVVMVGMVDEIAGFPNRIENDPLLELILPESEQFLYAEERRLFYVALTRAKNSVYILYNPDNCSAFVKELLRDHENGLVDICHQDFEGNSLLLNSEYYSCPNCISGEIVRKKRKNGGEFWGCTLYSYCSHISQDCPDCEAPTIRKDRKLQCRNEGCKWVAVSCGECTQGYIITRVGEYGKFQSCSRFPRCKYKPPSSSGKKYQRRRGRKYY